MYLITVLVIRFSRKLTSQLTVGRVSPDRSVWVARGRSCADVLAGVLAALKETTV